MKTIGLIGGMSWESTAHYYAAINRETARHLGGLHSAALIVHSVDFAPIAHMQAHGNWDEAGQYLAGAARQLAAGGADIIALATNTMHNVAAPIIAATPLPFLHIADPTAQALLEDGFKNIGLLGTRFTMEMPFYKERLQDAGLNIITPGVGHTELNGIIFDQLCRGIITAPARQTYVDAITRMQAQGAEAVILGCTEIAMLIDDTVSPLPTYDTTALHAKALAAWALGESD